MHERAWALPQWFDRLATQTHHPADCLTIVLNYGTSEDRTLEIIESEDRFKKIVVIETPGVPHQKDRWWTVERYEVMARLRNDMLSVVRDLAPDYFLSCDTDMMLPPDALARLASHAAVGWLAGVAPLTYMTPTGVGFPNWLTKTLQRPTVPNVPLVPQWAVFGTVLMTPRLYAVDYRSHDWGEDIGWACNVEDSGLVLALATQVKVKHVMDSQYLNIVDERVGF